MSIRLDQLRRQKGDVVDEMQVLGGRVGIKQRSVPGNRAGGRKVRVLIDPQSDIVAPPFWNNGSRWLLLCFIGHGVIVLL